jgi:trehalose monomycolate/heme transporter
MKRLQTRLGLGEIDLPDERKRPVVRVRPQRPADRGERAAPARIPAATRPRTPHEPTHPSPPSSRAGARPEQRQPTQDAPSASGTTRMRAPGSAGPREPTTTRFSAQKNAAPKPPSGRERPAKTSVPPPPGPRPARREDRETEFEAWISELRGPKPSDRPDDPRGTSNATPPSKPPADNARSMPAPTERPPRRPPANQEDSTTAIPTGPRETNDPQIATENLNSRGRNAGNSDRTRQRRGGGLSAQDLLRREGRY